MIYLVIALVVLFVLAQLLSTSAEAWASGRVPTKIERGELKITFFNMPPPAWWARLAGYSDLASKAFAGAAFGLLFGAYVRAFYC